MQNLNQLEVSPFQHQLFHIPTKNSCVYYTNMLEEMASKDMGKVVTEQQYYDQINREWMTQKTDRLMLRNDSSSHTVWTSFAKSFRPFSTYSALLGRHTRPAVPHSINTTTLAIKSWAQGMCNTSPASRQLFRWRHSKDWEQHPGIIIASDK